MLPHIMYPYEINQFTMTIEVKPRLSLGEQIMTGTINPQVVAGLYALIIVPLLTWLLPRILEGVYLHKQRRNLHRYLKEVNKLIDTSHQNEEIPIHGLKNQLRKIEEGYAMGKISESQFNFLKDKISDHVNDINKQ